MAKKTQSLEIGEEDDLFEDAAILAIRTSLSGPQFVSYLNRCFHLQLSRMDLLPDEIKALKDNSDHYYVPFMLPTYSYHDELSGLKCYVVDAWYYRDMPKELSFALNGCDKIMVFDGPDAYKQQQEFYRLLSLNDVDSKGDLSQRLDKADWDELVGSIIDVNYFDFSDNDSPKSSQWQSASDSYSPKLKKTIATMKAFFADVVYMRDEIGYAVECYNKIAKKLEPSCNQ